MNKGDLSHKCKVTETSENQYNSQLTRKNSHVNKCRKKHLEEFSIHSR